MSSSWGGQSAAREACERSIHLRVTCATTEMACPVLHSHLTRLLTQEWWMERSDDTEEQLWANTLV